MNNLLTFNVLSDICGVIFSVVGVTTLLIWRKYLDKTFRFFLLIFITNSVSLISNFLGLICKGMPGAEVNLLLRISNFFEFASGYNLSFFLTLYLFYFFEKKGHNMKFKKWLYFGYGIEILNLLLSQFNGMFYYIDSENIYHRGPLFFITQLFGIIFMIIDFLIIIKHYKILSKAELYVFILYTIAPIIALVVQVFFYGVYILLLTTTISAFVMLIMILSTQVKQYYEKEKELSDMKCLLLQSQLQPHFLFNSLVTIKHLCKTDPASAAQAVEDFSYFLRGNLESITANFCIPFISEMEHTKNYISLEKKRFSERLNVIYDIQETDFSIPPLTLQPIVENAIKYGTMQKMGEIEVKISTLYDDENYYVKICDNGMGFDPESYKSDGKNHIGIDVVKSKLNNMCNGSLVINSVIGQGSQVTICIPKKVKDI